MNHLKSIRTLSGLVTIAGILLLLFADYAGFFEGIDNYVYDTSFRMRGTLEPSEKIIIASIDEKTLERLGRWPISRSYYARMLQKLGAAEVVGFDLLLSDPSEDDALFAREVAKSGNVVLPVYIDDQLQTAYPLSKFSPYRAGHVHLELGIDHITREVFHTLYPGNDQLPSLASVIYEISAGKEMKRESVDIKNRRAGMAGDILQRDPMKINFYGTPGIFHSLSLIDILDDRYSPEFFSRKIILVGLTAPGIVDSVLTPFSNDRRGMPGVEVHAHIINNLLDGTYIYEVDGRTRWLLIALISLICGMLFARLNEKRATLLLIFGILLSTIVVYILFVAAHVWLRPGFLFALLIFLYVVIYVFKLDVAAKELDSKYLSLSALLGTGENRGDGKTPAHGLYSFLSTEGIDLKIRRLLTVERKYENRLEDTVKKRTHDLSDALSMLSNMSNEMVLRLSRAIESKDEITGSHVSRIGMYAKLLAEAMGMPSSFCDSIQIASAMHDVGKIGIPDNILLKDSVLTSEELKIMESHTTIGAKILSGSSYPLIQMASIIALYHHEKWDGNGYPKGLRGEEIPIEARIVSLCDHYDALASKRPYRPPFTHQEAVRMIREGIERTGPQYFDPAVLKAFIQVESSFETVVRSSQNEPVQPTSGI